MTTYRIAILGCQSRGTFAAHAYHAHPRTTVVALCDLIPERLNMLGDKLSVADRFTDLDKMIVETRPDIVAIPTATEFHYDLCMRVLEYGVNIDVEKPMCVDCEQADAVLAKAAEQDVKVAVHHQGRVSGLMRAVAKVLADGGIGELRYICGSGKGYYGGYGLMNIGTHMVNNLLKFLGRCRSVSAVAVTDGAPITPEHVVTSPHGMGIIAGEHITATLDFDNNVTANVLHHRFATVDSTQYGIELYGTEGRLVWKTRGAWWLPQPCRVPHVRQNDWQRLNPISPPHYDPGSDANEMDYWFVEEFVRALDEGRDHECSGAEARHAIEILMGIFESSMSGEMVTLPQEQRDHPLLRWRRVHGLSDPDPMPRLYDEWLAVEDQRLGRV